MRFDDTRPVYQRICQNITKRSLRTKSYTGDQAIFTRRDVFQKLGGYRDWPFMEDVDYSERMGKTGNVVLLNAEVETSARRHQRWGLLRTQLTVVSHSHSLSTESTSCCIRVALASHTLIWYI